MSFDWKSYATLVIALAGVLVPIWFAQSDVNGKSLSVRHVASTALAPPEIASVPRLAVTLEGVVVNSPYLSTLELKNNGNRPIPSTDFESPLEIATGGDVKVVRARVVDVRPGDPKATIDIEPHLIVVRPLLLNPGDTVSISALTSGALPVFVPSARIAGISRVEFVDATREPRNWLVLSVTTLLSLAGFVLYFVYAAAILRRGAVSPFRGLALMLRSNDSTRPRRGWLGPGSPTALDRVCPPLL